MKTKRRKVVATVTHSFFLSDREPIGSQVVQHLMIQQLLLHGIVQVHILIQEQMFLKQEEVMRMLALRLLTLRRPVSFPLGHDVGYLLFGDQRSLGRSQHLINCIA